MVYLTVKVGLQLLSTIKGNTKRKVKQGKQNKKT